MGFPEFGKLLFLTLISACLDWHLPICCFFGFVDGALMLVSGRGIWLIYDRFGGFDVLWMWVFPSVVNSGFW